MNKRILIIGNTKGLPGVKVDLINYTSFFKSSYGGCWIDSEIIVLQDPSKLYLNTVIEGLKKSKLDYLITVFSGHGGQERETILEINGNGECISESDLKNISTKQLNIFDCCRCYSETEIKSVRNLFEIKLMSLVNTRAKYENRISKAVNQNLDLYACSIGELANDTHEGGAYSKSLINVCMDFPTEYMLVGNAHEMASLLTKEKFPRQNPDAILPRLLSEQQLILGVNPKVL